MMRELREQVLHANLELARRGLARFTFGNASAIDRASGLVAIKPSGMPYDHMAAADLVVVTLEGQVVEGAHRPSSDLATHLVLYRAFNGIGGITHTHSHYATVWAQARREIPCLGTTHADHFHGSIPVTEPLTPAETADDYEVNTGQMIVRRMAWLDTRTMPAVLVSGHAPFCWGDDVSAAVETASLLEEVARLAYHTALLAPDASPIDDHLRDRHFHRKHGDGRYYGQP